MTRRPRAPVMLLCALVALAPAAVPASASAPARWARVQVTAREFRLTLSRPRVQPSRLIVQLLNAGEDGHDLAIRKAGLKRTYRISEQRPGRYADLTVPVSRGRYELWCTLPGHRARGMRATLVVR